MNTDTLKGKKILLVEDNEMNRIVASLTLEAYGIIITTAENGQEAVDAVKKDSYDIILMDMQMPVMDGLEATRVIRNEGYTQIPIIALTANAITGESERCKMAGMDDYLSKPFEERELLKVLQKWMTKN